MEPEETTVAVTAEQLAGLDLLIERKRASAEDVTADVANAAGEVAVQTVAAAAVQAKIGGPAGITAAAVTLGVAAGAAAVEAVTNVIGETLPRDAEGRITDEAVRERLNRAVGDMRVEDLIELRNRAMLAE
jgi:hypothetical protein